MYIYRKSLVVKGNHYHLLIETPDANLSRIMRHINGVYTQRHNRIKKTDGPLFRGRYKAILVDADSYLLQLSRYIHRNPIEIKQPLVSDLQDWAWSSYSAYVNKISAPHWLQREKRRGYRSYVADENDTAIKAFYGKGHIGAILGSSEFKENIIEREKLSEREVIKGVITRPSAEKIIDTVATIFAVPTQKITQKCMTRQEGNLARKMAVYCCQQLGGLTLNKIAQLFGFASDSSVAGCLCDVRKKLQDHNVELLFKQGPIQV